MAINTEALSALECFLDEGWISDVLYEVKSGKEATVYCCRGGPRAAPALAPPPASSAGAAASVPLVAAKVYRGLEARRFKNDAIYQTGRVHLARRGRAQRAAENKSAFGRKLQYAMWLEHEWQTMNLLFDAGADVPAPLARGERAILMAYLGDVETPASSLNAAELDREETARATDRLLWNIELMLRLDRVHGDLSPFNVLYWDGRATIIDFPQAIDPRLNPAGETLLARDIANICDWAKRRGVQRDAQAIVHKLWSRFVIGEIG